MLFGAHIGIGGAFPHRPGKRTLADAPEVGAHYACDVIQLFSKNQRQWAVPELAPEMAGTFRKNAESHLKGPALIHTTYLLNLASADDALWEKSVTGLAVEVERADALGIPWIVFHPGSPRDAGRDFGLDRVAAGVTEVVARTKESKTQILLETNAGAGACVGRSFEELATMLDGIEGPKSRVAVCFDTCHVFVSGYDIRTDKGYDATFAEFDDQIGLDRLACFHLNDAKEDLGSNKDRHAIIGGGNLGKPFWARLVNDARFEDRPAYLETPDAEEGYVKDLAYLRGLQS